MHAVAVCGGGRRQLRLRASTGGIFLFPLALWIPMTTQGGARQTINTLESLRPLNGAPNRRRILCD